MDKWIVLAVALVTNACSQSPPEPAPVDVTTTTPAASVPGAVPQRTLIATRSSLSANVSELRVRVTDASTIVDLPSDVLFEFGSATLGAGAQSQLTKVVPLIERGKPGVVDVIGHTDAVGDDASNLVLSEQRARAVIAWLKQTRAVADREFKAIGRGETEPIAPNANADGRDDPDGRARNRRVELVIPR